MHPELPSPCTQKHTNGPSVERDKYKIIEKYEAIFET